MNSAVQHLYQRHNGIDAFRYIAFIFVVLLHCFVTSDQEFHYSIWVYQAGRFAVPFFFIASGYFMARSDHKFLEGVIKVAKRLAPIFIVWLLIYFLLFGQIKDLLQLKSVVRLLITGGKASFHLWFLPALGISMIMILGLKRFSMNLSIFVAFFLFLFGLLKGPYREFFDIAALPISSRNGPFFSFAFVLTGYLISRKKISLSTRWAIFTMLFGLSLQISEAFLISYFSNARFIHHDFLIGTYFFGVGVFFIALNTPSSKPVDFLARLGAVSLGMYCIHLMFIRWMEGYFERSILAEDVIIVFTVIILSTISSFLLSKIPYLRKLVS